MMKHLAADQLHSYASISKNSMKDICSDLGAEYHELTTLVRSLTHEQWKLRSEFYGWTPWDEIAHLCYFDETALQSVTDAEGFMRDARALNARIARGEEISAVARTAYAHLDGPALLEHWQQRHQRLVEALARLEPKTRLSWYGPQMSARSFAAARLMETWAHGQDVWDAVRRKRLATARLKHIAHIGVMTFGWTFANRGLEVPSVMPGVELAAPDGATWAWGEPSGSDFVRGTAEDFCLLVTQRRHLEDTGLQYSNGAAQRWLSMAQCFAGPPANGPAPGMRRVRY
jgi:uncharacterized protein (TIGR03084 family)